MTKFKVMLSQTAVSQLSLLGSSQKDKVKEALRQLEDNPFQKRPGADIKKLIATSDPSLFRLRIGSFRAIYFIVDQEVLVTEIIHRSKGYRWLE